MFINKWLKMITPKGFLWRLTLTNVIVIGTALALTGWAIYETACNIVGGIGSPSSARQIQFNATLFHYFLIITGLGILISTLIHFYLTKKLIRPIKELIKSTKLLKKGNYPASIQIDTVGEISELIEQYNALTDKLRTNEAQRKKLIDDLSHEIRTPIANIKGYLYALKEGDLQGDPSLFHSLYEQAEQLANLIDQLEHLHLWSENIEEIGQKKESVQIDEIIENSINLFSWQIKKENIKVTKRIERTKLQVHKEGLQQAIANLIENAIRYRIDDSNIAIVGNKLQDYYEIQVIGRGETIPVEAREQLFERFYRVETSRNRKTGGSGLGLAIAKEIIENHGGTITFKTDDSLHTFTITMPLNGENYES